MPDMQEASSGIVYRQTRRETGSQAQESPCQEKIKIKTPRCYGASSMISIITDYQLIGIEPFLRLPSKPAGCDHTF